MKVTKEQIEQLLSLTKALNLSTTMLYIPWEYLDDKEALYGLYYGGSLKLELSAFNLYYEGKTIKVNEINEPKIVETILTILSNDMSYELRTAFEKLNWEYEELKYFDRSPQKYQQFKDTVLKQKGQ